jgi:hypothetical protein
MMRAVHLVVAAALAAVPAACDDAGGGGEETPPPVTQAPASAGTGDGTQTNQPPPPPGGVLASREFQAEGLDLRAEITGLARQGQTVLLSWTITNTSEDTDWYIGSSLNDPNDESAQWNVSGVALVDPINGQRYLVARAGSENPNAMDGTCVCTSVNNTPYVRAGQTAQFNATYSAPPPELASINVDMPLAGVFTDVPIS